MAIRWRRTESYVLSISYSLLPTPYPLPLCPTRPTPYPLTPYSLLSPQYFLLPTSYHAPRASVPRLRAMTLTVPLGVRKATASKSGSCQ